MCRSHVGIEDLVYLQSNVVSLSPKERIPTNRSSLSPLRRLSLYLSQALARPLGVLCHARLVAFFFLPVLSLASLTQTNVSNSRGELPPLGTNVMRTR